MDYPLAVSPDLKIGAKEFAATWNQGSESSTIAEAHAAAAGKESCPFISPEMIHQGLVLLAGVASTVALDVIKDVVKERVTKILSARSGSDAVPLFEVIVIQPGDKTMIIVKAKA